ncbi:MAG: SOS response-associated peptidase [Chloroflexi bacterium]|nr:SOS response-associated peptidase [Chloroflexota bacterium]
MCGRFTLASDPATLQEAFPGFALPPTGELRPRYNIAPSQDIAAIANDAQNRVRFFRWGLIPFWAKDEKVGYRMINARAETLAEKPSFRTAYRKRRCLILADGFYEWQSDGRTKTPMYVRLKSKEPFAFAGLWEVWSPTNESAIYSCTIITTTPNTLLEPIHNRMPVILPPEAYDLWLDPTEQTPDHLHDLLAPYPPEQMIAHPVSTLVNNPRHDSPDCIIPD